MRKAKTIIGYILAALFLLTIGAYSEDSLMANIFITLIKVGFAFGAYICLESESEKSDEIC